MFGSITCAGAPDEKFYALNEVNIAYPSAPAPYDKLGIQKNTSALRDGDFLRVFNSIAQGHKILDVEIDFEVIHDKYGFQEYQKDFDHATWAKLFALRLPARLTTHDGKKFEGMLDPFYETGMEQTGWTLYDFNRLGYGSLHNLQKGDLLEIFSAVTEGNIEWQGRVRIAPEPEITGQNIMLVGADETLRDDPAALAASMRFSEVQERFLHTVLYPERKKLDEFAQNNLPVQLVR